MGFEEGFEALTNGDYRRAVDLLERAAADSAFTSDRINHAYTLALYRANERARLADVAFQVGSSLAESDPASAMDYFQRALQAGLNGERTRTIAEIHEKWMAERERVPIPEAVHAVGHVINSLVPEQTQAVYIRLLIESLRSQGIESRVFTTESGAAWFNNPSTTPLTTAAATEALAVPVTVASVAGDFEQRSQRVADSIRDSGLPLIFYHSGFSDQIAARVAGIKPAPLQVSVNHETGMDANLFDGFIHLSRNALERSRHGELPAVWIPATSDIVRRLQGSGFESRASLGVDAATSLSASFSGPTRDQTAFVNALIEILKRFPGHFHFFAGAGDVRAFRGLLHSEGVLSRIRFLGQVSDTLRLLGAVDVYVAPFPDAGSGSVLELMGAGKPIVAMKYPSNAEFNTTAELVDLAELTPLTPAEYIQCADRLIRDAAHRSRLGDALQERFQAEFRPSLLGERYVAFIRKLGLTPSSNSHTSQPSSQ
jgi:glycosyltransferase involved in cell wall biosynthesis